MVLAVYVTTAHVGGTLMVDTVTTIGYHVQSVVQGAT